MFKVTSNNVKMDTIRLTPTNAKSYIGCQILFKTRGKYVVQEIMNVSESGKTITINNPDLKNSLEIVSRRVYVIVKD